MLDLLPDLQPVRIGVAQRIVEYIDISVDAARKPNRVTLNVSPGSGVVVAEEVVVGIGFLIRILSWEAEVELKRGPGVIGIGLRRAVAEGLCGRQVPPNGVVLFISDQSGCVEVIRVDVIDTGLGRRHRNGDGCRGRLRPHTVRRRRRDGVGPLGHIAPGRRIRCAEDGLDQRPVLEELHLHQIVVRIGCVGSEGDVRRGRDAPPPGSDWSG